MAATSPFVAGPARPREPDARGPRGRRNNSSLLRLALFSLPLLLLAMGKIHNNDLSDIKVKVPRRRNDAVCGAEVVGFLSCLDANNHNEASCVAQMKALSECMEVAFAGGAMGQRRHKPPTNYHIRQVRIAVQLCYAPSLHFYFYPRRGASFIRAGAATGSAAVLVALWLTVAFSHRSLACTVSQFDRRGTKKKVTIVKKRAYQKTRLRLGADA